MKHPAIMLLRSRADFWEQVCSGHQAWNTVLSLIFFIATSSAVYGAALAGWRPGLLPLFVAVKLPILLLGTTSLVMLLNWMSATALGSGLSFRQTVLITYGAMGVACWILLSLVPVTLLFTYGVASGEGSHEDLRLTHNCLLLTHIALIAFAGVAGNSTLRQGLRLAVNPACSVRKIYVSWLAAFALVGCQLSWILRPFVGSPFYKVEFMRPDALSRNFFEFVFGDVLPHVLTGGG